MTFKDMKYQLIVEKVTEVFLEKGINDVTIKDAAQAVGLGEATIYRYFSKKENLVIEAATKLEEKIIDEYFKEDNSLSGYEAIHKFYNSFLEVFNKRKEFYRFIAEFDNFVLGKDCSLKEYESKLRSFYQVFMNGYNKGLKDLTVKAIDNINDFYLSTTHSLMGLAKKLASSDILEQDHNTNKVKELEILIDIIMNSIKG